MNLFQRISKKGVKLYNKIDTYSIKENNRKVLFGLSALIIFFILYAFNYIHPLINDDWTYSFIVCPDEELVSQRIRGISDIFESQYIHYFVWGGRIPAHFLLQLILYWGESWAKIINSLMYVVYIFMIYKIVNIGRKKDNVLLFIIVFLLAWLLQPTIQNSSLWLTGSCNYLWTTTFVLLFLFNYCKYYLKEDKSNQGIKIPLMFILGVLAGWSNENMSVGCVCLLLILFILMKTQKTSVPAWAITGFAGLLIGCCFLFLAPGNFVRLEVMLKVYQIDHFSDIQRFVSGFFRFLQSYYFYGLIITVIYGITLLFYYSFGKKSKSKKYLYLSISFFVAGILAALSMTFSPNLPVRTWFGPITLMTIAILLIWMDVDFSHAFVRRFCQLLFVASAITFSVQFYLYMKDLYQVKKAFDQRIEFLEEQKKLGIDEIVFDIRPQLNTNFFVNWDLSTDPNDWANETYSVYYGVKSVRLEKECK